MGTETPTRAIISVQTHHIKRTYRTELDGLRALAVLAVLINHAKGAWLAGGFLGVDCFFVLSGYVVAGSWVLPSGRRKSVTSTSDGFAGFSQHWL